MKQNYIFAFAISVMLFFSCSQKPSGKNSDYEFEVTDSVNYNNDKIMQISLPENDSIACYLDSVIGRYHVKHFTQNDSTGICIDAYINHDEGLDSIIHYDRKLNIYIGDNNYVFQKTITREELANLAELTNYEDYKRLCVRYVNVELINDSTLLYRIKLEEKDDWGIFFYFEYSNKSFIYKRLEGDSDY